MKSGIFTGGFFVLGEGVFTMLMIANDSEKALENDA